MNRETIFPLQHVPSSLPSDSQAGSAAATAAATVGHVPRVQCQKFSGGSMRESRTVRKASVAPAPVPALLPTESSGVCVGYGQHQQSWTRCEELGRGAHGTVYRALVMETGESIAVKQILTAGMSRSELQVAENEISTQRKLRHPNVVPLLGVEKADDHLNIFLEYMEGGSLKRLLEREGPMSEGQAAAITKRILDGLEYLHSNDIAHRDIKGANVLLSKTGAVKLADFGTSKPLDQESIKSGLKGTPNWMAPEVIRDEVARGAWPQADVWSVGCTVVEMLTGKVPWPDKQTAMAAMYKISEGGKPPLNRYVSQEAASFMAACMATDPSQRHTVKQLMEHPFLARARSPVEAAASFSPRQTPSPPSPNAEDDRHQHHHHHHHHHYYHHVGGDGDGGEALGGIAGDGEGYRSLRQCNYCREGPSPSRQQFQQRRLREQRQQRPALPFSMHAESTDQSGETGGSSGDSGSGGNDSGDNVCRYNPRHFHQRSHSDTNNIAKNVNVRNSKNSENYNNNEPVSCGGRQPPRRQRHRHDHHHHHHDRDGDKAVPESGARRPPCRSRETACTGSKGQQPWLRNARGAGSGDEGSGRGECGEERWCPGRWQQEPRGTTRRVGRNRAPPSTPTGGGVVSTGLCPRAAAAAVEAAKNRPSARRHRACRQQHKQRQQDKMAAGSDEPCAMVGPGMRPDCRCDFDGDNRTNSSNRNTIGDGSSRPHGYAFTLERSISSPAAGSTPYAASTYPYTRLDSSSVSPRDRTHPNQQQQRRRRQHQPHQHHRRHPQHHRRELSLDSQTAVCVPVFDASLLLTEGGGGARQSVALQAHSAAAGGCNSDKAEAGGGQRRQTERWRGTLLTNASVLQETKDRRNHAGTADVSFTTSPVTTPRQYSSSPSHGSGGGGESRADAIAAPCHGGSGFDGDLGDGSAGRGPPSSPPSPPRPSDNSGLRRGSSYSSPAQVVQAARDTLVEWGNGRRGGGGGSGPTPAGPAAAAAPTAAPGPAVAQLTRPDDPITGEYLKLERQRELLAGRADGRHGRVRRWRSMSIPLEHLRTKSAGVLGASTKLPPLERNAAVAAAAAAAAAGGRARQQEQGQEGGGGGGGRAGGGGRGSGRELGALSGFTRGITSAPTTGGSSFYSSATEAEAVAGAENVRGQCPRAASRAADLAAGLSVPRYSAERRSLASSAHGKEPAAGGTGARAGAGAGGGEVGGGARPSVFHSRSLAPIRRENVPPATSAGISPASFKLTAATTSQSGELDVSGALRSG